MAQVDRRRADHELIRTAATDVVLVDTHAHNLVEVDSPLSFLHTFVEAGDDVFGDVPHTLPFKRGVEDVASLYEINASLESIEEHRKLVGLESLSVKCFEAANIDILLLDDGLALEKMKDLSWHTSVVKQVHRIARIEAVAEEILKEDPPGGLVYWNFKELEEQFLSRLNSLLSSVVSFKSIAAYRSGLSIDPAATYDDAEEGLQEDIKLALGKKRPVRLQNKNVIDILFIRALELATSHGIPIQIHTGFGDKDLDLRLANPLNLRSVLEDQRFATSRLVLLHASYPYMREASYLASVYPQVFLDFGLAIPKLTVRGMKSSVAELLELAPINKVMFSTDGGAFPETYFLGAKWARSIVAHVLCEAYDDGDLSVDQAIGAAEAVLRENALTFYKLRPQSDEMKTKKSNKEYEKEAEEEIEEGVKREQLRGCVRKSDYGGIGKMDHPTSWLDNVKYVRLLWADGSGQRRCRVVPSARYKASVAKTGVGLTKVCMGMSSYTDCPAEGSGLTASGEIRLIPDANTEVEVPQWGHGLVLVDMHEKRGIPWALCPRTTLRRMTDLLNEEFGLILRAGFEIEFYLLRQVEQNGRDCYQGVDFSCYCSTIGLNKSLPTVESILSWLESFQLDFEQFHAEGGGGQFEVVLAHETALKSADNLLLAREAITAAAITHDLIATFLPKLNLENTAFGNGCHVHFSLWKDGNNVLSAESISDSKYGLSAAGEHFVAGVLHHLPSVLAFIAPHPNSYKRIQPNTWSGAFQCWGNENKEAPLRAVADLKREGVVNNFELKSFDGCANPHLGLAAVVAAGLDGLRKQLKLPPPIDLNPADLKAGQVARLPTKLEEATSSLEQDEELKALMGEKLVTAIIAIRKTIFFSLKRLEEDDSNSDEDMLSS